MKSRVNYWLTHSSRSGLFLRPSKVDWPRQIPCQSALWDTCLRLPQGQTSPGSNIHRVWSGTISNGVARGGSSQSWWEPHHSMLGNHSPSEDIPNYEEQNRAISHLEWLQGGGARCMPQWGSIQVWLLHPLLAMPPRSLLWTVEPIHFYMFYKKFPDWRLHKY